MNRSVPLRIGLWGLLLALYLASTVPVGLFLYSLKSNVGLDVFKKGGFHAYMQCLSASFPLEDRADGGRTVLGAKHGAGSASVSPAVAHLGATVGRR